MSDKLLALVDALEVRGMRAEKAGACLRVWRGHTCRYLMTESLEAVPDPLVYVLDCFAGPWVGAR